MWWFLTFMWVYEENGNIVLFTWKPKKKPQRKRNMDINKEGYGENREVRKMLLLYQEYSTWNN